VIERLPTPNALVVNVAVPPDNVPVPRVNAPSRNVTVPVGVATVVLPVTVAVKVTVCPKTDGSTDEATVVVVLARVTVSGSHGLRARLLLVSPLYVALKLKDPAAVGVIALELGTTPFVTVTVPAAVAVPLQVPVFQNE